MALCRLQETEGALRKQGGAIFYTFFVEGNFGVVEEEAVVVSSFCTEEVELAGHLAGIEGEVLSYEAGQTGDDVLFAEELVLDGF